MIQDIHPHRIDLTFRNDSAEPGDFVIVLRKGKMLFRREAGADGTDGADAANGLAIPSFADLGSPGNAIRLFSVGGLGVHCLDGDFSGDAPAGHEYRDFTSLREYSPRWQAFVAMTGGHLASWYAANRFCGACGAAMTRKRDERAVLCPACGMTSYPRISPAVIVGIIDRAADRSGDRILMTRYANRPGSKLTALIAGFVEAGEAVEDTIRREVFEETGVRLKNIRYYKSQPWAFSQSVLMGFYADLDGPPEITLDASELAEAKWIRREDLALGDSGFSLTSEMVDRFRKGGE